MRPISIHDFLDTGRLAQIELGAARANVRAAWGMPDAGSAPGFPRIERYGPIQLTFDGERVTGIVISVANASRRDVPAPRVDGLDILARCTVSDFLGRSDGYWVTVAALTFDSQHALMQTASGVEALFVDGRLSKLYVRRKN